MNRKHLFYLVFVVLMMATAACRCGAVGSDEVPIETLNNEARGVGQSGKYYINIDPRTGLEKINIGVKSADWSDPDLVSGDLQPIGLSLNIEFRRPSDEETLLKMWKDYNQVLRDDNALQQKVLDKVFNSAKSATAQLTVLQMLGNENVTEDQVAQVAAELGIDPLKLKGVQGRQLLNTMIEILLQKELEQTGIIVVAVTANNVSPSEEYLRNLEAQANARIERQVVTEQRTTNQEKLKNEQVETEIQLEIASREKQVNELKAAPYDKSPAYLALEMARITAEAIGEGDTIIFIPPGSNLATMLGQQGVVPFVEIPQVLDEVYPEGENLNQVAPTEVPVEE